MNEKQIHGIMTTIEGLDDYVRRLDEFEPTLRQISAHHTIGCPEGCGACCHTSQQNVAVSVFEALPLACHLWASGMADDVLLELERLDDTAPCHFYTRTETEPGRGFCSVYPYRFLVCRLFNQAYRRRKDGSLEVLACRLLRESKSNPATPAANPIVAADLAEELEALNPNLSSKKYPVNDAVKKALEYVGMRLYLNNNQDSTADEPNDDPTLPLKPCA